MENDRWNTLQDRVRETATVESSAKTLFVLAFFNNHCEFVEVVTPDEIDHALATHRPCEGTLLYGAMAECLQRLSAFRDVTELSLEVITDDGTSDAARKDEVTQAYVDFFKSRASQQTLSTSVVVRSWAEGVPGPLAVVQENLMSDPAVARAVEEKRLTFDVVSPQLSVKASCFSAASSSSNHDDPHFVIVPELRQSDGRSIEEELVLGAGERIELQDVSLLLPANHVQPDDVSFKVLDVDPGSDVQAVCWVQDPTQIRQRRPFDMTIELRGAGLRSGLYRALIVANLKAEGGSCGEARFDLRIVRPRNAITGALRRLMLKART
jgi:hypothetical protein